MNIQMEKRSDRMTNASNEIFLLLVSVAVITPCSLGGGKNLFFIYVLCCHKETHHSRKEQIAVFLLTDTVA